ncbi:hypothetical protein Tco_1269935, partial [Tanacetum coccineum]
MRTRSQTRNRNHQQQAQPAVVQPFHLEEPFVNPPLVPMADNRTMTQLLQAPTEGYEDAIVIPEINANFELKHDYFNSSNENPLFNEMVEDVKNENSNVSNSDEPVFLNTPLTDKVEYFDSKDNIDEIDAFLAMEVSSNFEEGYYDSE